MALPRPAATAPPRELIKSQEQHGNLNSRTVASSSSDSVIVLALCDSEAPELAELGNLPPCLRVVGVGRNPQELADAGVSEDILTKVQVLLNTSRGRADVTHRQDLQELWPKLKSLKWLHTTTAGINHLLFPELVDSPVIITNSKGNCKAGLAEYAMSAILFFAKRVSLFRAQQQARAWNFAFTEGIRGKTLGVLGFGEIGQETARLAQAFGMRVIALRRNSKLSAQDQADGLQVFPPEQLHDLLSQSDYIISSLPSTPATYHFLDAKAFAAMRPNAVVVNVGRGTTIHEDALITALQEGKIRGAALDVFEHEPLPPDSPLWSMENVLMTPHCGGVAPDFWKQMFQQFVQHARRFVGGERMLHVTDKVAGY